MNGPYLSKDVIADREEVARTTIRQGRGNLMPGFQYGLSDSVVDAIFDFLGTVPPRDMNPTGPANSGKKPKRQGEQGAEE
jgi:hypothetical protein